MSHALPDRASRARCCDQVHAACRSADHPAAGIDAVAAGVVAGSSKIAAALQHTGAQSMIHPPKVG